ncbi:glycoside hydrolase family 28 protein [Wenyingzhuangia sp. IMCC45467]
MKNKKGFIKDVAKAAFLFVGFLVAISCKQKEQSTSPWEKVAEIKKQVKVPKFPDNEFNILDFGAVNNGVFNNTEVFKKAIAECSASGGGKVVVPAGKYFTGPIHLESNVNLHIKEGAEVLFSNDTKDFAMVNTSYEGTEMINYSPLIYAYQKENIAITGKGILNGQGDRENWWPWCGSKRYGWKEGLPRQKEGIGIDLLMKMAEDNIPVKDRVFGEGHYLRPNFIEPFESKNILIQGVKIINAPFWVIHPFRSENIIVDEVTVDSHGPNNDGCDPEYSKNIIIKNCVFNTGDDCIAIKAGRDADGRRVGIKSENILIQNCKMLDGHGGVVIGSEMSAGVNNVFVENCEMNSANLDRAIRIKTNTRRGGTVDGVYVRNLKVGQVKEAVLKLNMHYAIHGDQKGNFMPSIKNVLLEDVVVKNGGRYGILAKGYEKSPIDNITFKNVTIEKVEKDFSLDYVTNLTIIDSYINGKKAENPQE